MRFCDIYERTAEDALNHQILQFIRNDSSNDDYYYDSTAHRLYLHMQVMRNSNMPMLIDKHDDLKIKECTQNCFCEENKNKTAMSEIIMKQLTHGKIKCLNIIR